MLVLAGSHTAVRKQCVDSIASVVPVLAMTAPAPIEFFIDETRTRVARRVALIQSTESTNALALDLVRSGQIGHGDAIITDHQTRGRGTQGRTWVDAPGTAILASVVVATDGHSPASLALPPAVAIVRWLAARFDIITATTRWPNDVYVNTHKLAGVLIETAFNPVTNESLAVVGVGINLKQTDFPDQHALQATSVQLHVSRDPDLGLERRHFLNELDAAFQYPFENIRAAWQQHNADIGTRVRVRTVHGIANATVTGIDQDAALLIRPDNDPGQTIRIVSSAELERLPSA